MTISLVGGHVGSVRFQIECDICGEPIADHHRGLVLVEDVDDGDARTLSVHKAEPCQGKGRAELGHAGGTGPCHEVATAFVMALSGAGVGPADYECRVGFLEGIDVESRPAAE